MRDSISEGPSSGSAGRREELGPRTRESDISVLRLANAVLAHRSLMIFLPLLAACTMVLATILTPRAYVASASFAPQQEDGTLRTISGLASRLGVELPSQAPSESPRFYAELLESRRILEPTVQHTYWLGSVSDEPSERTTLVEFFQGSTAEASAESTRKAMDRLRRNMRVRADSETGMVQYTVEARRPELAEQIAVQLLASLSAFNSESRQSRAAEERAFVEARLQETDRELKEREGHLESFLRDNRRYENSPDLTFQFERLRRELELQGQLHSSLSEAYEQARIEEVRNTPILTVIDMPQGSVRPKDFRLGLRLLLSGLVGFVLALFVATSRELSGAPQLAETDELERFRALQADARGDLVRLWRRVRRALTIRRAA